jgi:hypothetical protein
MLIKGIADEAVSKYKCVCEKENAAEHHKKIAKTLLIDLSLIWSLIFTEVKLPNPDAQ